ncbi:MAG: hypothetical protein IKV94_02720 [Clostridia bacterium]|nr:hypothetical protein [Clostridia bacterium]MBR6517145.1 hypothetical protein [Bacilli bacterium]
MIQTIINEPLVLTSNTSPIVFDATNIRTRCAYCCNGGWLDYENGSPLFRVFGNNYNGYYNANFSASISSATAGVIAIGLYEDGVLLPDTVRAVTIDAPDDYETVSFNRKIRLCPRGTSTLTVGSVPSVVTPTDPTTPIETEIPIITNATFNLSRSNN